MTITRRALFVVLGITLGLIAWAAPETERQTDRGAYEATASQFIVRDCSDLHCFRVLVPWTLGAIPGPSLPKWKAYAVVANLFAAVAVFALSIAWGMSQRASMMASLLSALGFGSLYTLFDPFTSDPLMYAIGPLLVWLLLKDRIAAAGLVAAIGALAKEFAAAPMLIWSAATAATGRWTEALRVLSAANVALIAWLSLQLILIIGFNYSYADNASTHLLSGGYLWRWLSTQTWLVSALAMFGEFGMLWLLAPAGLFLAPAPMRRFVVASIPVALLFAYVQQPDRALWNFHFLAAPLAALVLERAPAALAGASIGMFALGNLRLGAQLSMVPPSRVSLVLSALLAIACLYRLRAEQPPSMAVAS
jgi:hypothetical protein